MSVLVIFIHHNNGSSKKRKKNIEYELNINLNYHISSHIMTKLNRLHLTFVAVINLSTNFEYLVKIGAPYSEIFGAICQFLPIFVHLFKNSTNPLLKLRSYWNDLHVFTRWRGIPSAINAILHSVSERQSKEWKQSSSTYAKKPLKLIGYHSDIPQATAKLMLVL